MDKTDIRLSGYQGAGYQRIRVSGKTFDLIFWYPDNLLPDILMS